MCCHYFCFKLGGEFELWDVLRAIANKVFQGSSFFGISYSEGADRWRGIFRESHMVFSSLRLSRWSSRRPPKVVCKACVDTSNTALYILYTPYKFYYNYCVSFSKDYCLPPWWPEYIQETWLPHTSRCHSRNDTKLWELAVRVRHRYVREVQSLCWGHGTLDIPANRGLAGKPPAYPIESTSTNGYMF